MLHENIAKIRKERGLTQEALSVKLNVVRQTISKWEKGTAVPDADTLCRIADALDVSVSTLLGGSEQEDKIGTASIVESLAQINEQLAIRNRRTANIWKVLFLISLVVIGILIGKSYWGNSNLENPSQTILPERIEASSVFFQCNGKDLTCSFVPSIGNDDITYSVTLAGHDNSFPGATAVSEYENGICVATFDASELSEYVEYRVVLRMEYRGEVRNMTLADAFCFQENGCSWENWE